MHFRGAVSVLCTLKQVGYIPYTWCCVRIHTLVSQIAQHLCPQKVQFRPTTSGKLGGFGGKVPALTGRV